MADFQQGTVKLDPAVFVQQEMGLHTQVIMLSYMQKDWMHLIFFWSNSQ